MVEVQGHAVQWRRSSCIVQPLRVLEMAAVTAAKEFTLKPNVYVLNANSRFAAGLKLEAYKLLDERAVWGCLSLGEAACRLEQRWSCTDRRNFKP